MKDKYYKNTEDSINYLMSYQNNLKGTGNLSISNINSTFNNMNNFKLNSNSLKEFESLLD